MIDASVYVSLARENGRRQRVKFIAEFDVVPGRFHEAAGQWDISSWTIVWRALQDLGAEDFEGCRAAWEEAFWGHPDGKDHDPDDDATTPVTDLDAVLARLGEDS